MLLGRSNEQVLLSGTDHRALNWKNYGGWRIMRELGDCTLQRRNTARGYGRERYSPERGAALLLIQVPPPLHHFLDIAMAD